MNFTDLAPNVQKDVESILSQHLHITLGILEEDKCLIPMLMIEGVEPSSNQLISLQSQDGSINVDKAYAVALQRLQNTEFAHALFSYTAQVGFADGKLKDVVKTCIFMQDGLAVVCYTPFVLKGIFKKKAIMDETIVAEIIENVWA